MKLLELFFLRKNKWIVFLPIILIWLSSSFFPSKYFFEKTDRGTTELNVGHPLPTILLILYQATWYWTLGNYFNNTIETNSKYNLNWYKKSLLACIIAFTCIFIFAYINAERIFHSTVLLTAIFITIFIFFIVFFYNIWLTRRIVYTALKLEQEQPLDPFIGFFKTCFFPIYLWKLQPLIQNVYVNLNKNEEM